MYEQTFDDVTGDWGPAVWLDPAGTSAYNAPTVQNPSVIGATAAPAAGQDQWSGFFQQMLGGAVNYAIQKDAQRNGLVQATAANGQPVYTSAALAPLTGMNSNLLVIGAAIIAGILLLKKG